MLVPRKNKWSNLYKENEKKLKEIDMLKKCDDSKKFLQDHPHFVCENTANYLVWCTNLEMDSNYLSNVNSGHLRAKYARE